MSAGSEIFRERIREVAGANRIHCCFKSIRYTDGRHFWLYFADIEQHISRVPVPIFGTSRTARIDEMHSFNRTMPRFMSMPKTHNIA